MIKKLLLSYALILPVGVLAACASAPDQTPAQPHISQEQFMENMHERIQNSEEQKRAAFLRNMENSEHVSDDDKLESWRARMDSNANNNTNTLMDRQRAYEERMRASQSR